MAQKPSDPRKRRHPIEAYDPGDWGGSDCIDDECSKKDQDIAMLKSKVDHYKEKLLRYNDLTRTLTNEKAALNEELNNKKLLNEDLEKRNNSLVKCVREQHTREQEKDRIIMSVRVQNEQLQKKLTENQKQLTNTEEVNNNLKNSYSEAKKRSETTIKKLKADITELTKKLKAKTDEDVEGMEEKNQTIERLENELKCKAIKAEKYKTSFEKCRTEYMALRESNKKLTALKEENQSLKRQREYFQNQNENNKRKNVGVSQTLIRSKAMYRALSGKLAQNSINTNKQIFQQMREYLETAEKESQSKILDNFANEVQNMQKEGQEIEESEKRILEKRADGRVNCGQCEHTFASPTGLAQHMTMTHKVNVTDRSKNAVEHEIITIE